MAKIFFKQPKAKKIRGGYIKPKGLTYSREPFIKKVFGEVREFANRQEYKAFYRRNRRNRKLGIEIV